MTINDIRRQNLEILILEATTIRALAERCELSDSYISQVRNAHTDSRNNTPRNIGDEAARKLEIGMNRDVGWMDRSHLASTSVTHSRAGETTPEVYTDPRRRRLIVAFEEMTDTQIDEMLSSAERTARTNREIEAAMAAKKKNAA